MRNCGDGIGMVGKKKTIMTGGFDSGVIIKREMVSENAYRHPCRWRHRRRKWCNRDNFGQDRCSTILKQSVLESKLLALRFSAVAPTIRSC